MPPNRRFPSWGVEHAHPQLRPAPRSDRDGHGRRVRACSGNTAAITYPTQNQQTGLRKTKRDLERTEGGGGGISLGEAPRRAASRAAISALLGRPALRGGMPPGTSGARPFPFVFEASATCASPVAT